MFGRVSGLSLRFVGPIPPDVEKKGGEGSMFHFSDALIVCSLLLLLILLVALTEGSIPVTLREGAEHPYVKKCTAPVSFPKVICCNI